MLRSIVIALKRTKYKNLCLEQNNNETTAWTPVRSPSPSGQNKYRKYSGRRVANPKFHIFYPFGMNEPVSNKMPEPKKVGVWAEGTRIEAKEFVMPKKSPDSSDDIPTIPDLDDLQDILEKEICMPPPATDHKDSETANALAEVGGGISGTADSIEAVLQVLNSYIPDEELDTADTVWTVDSLLTQLADECSDST